MLDRPLSLRRGVLLALAGGALFVGCAKSEEAAPAAPAAPARVEAATVSPGPTERPAPASASPGVAVAAAPAEPSAMAARPALVNPADFAAPPLLALTVQTADGADRRLADYRGKVLLVVNTATGCGFTPQLAGLQRLRERFAARGFEVLAFPSDDFDQDPGTAAESRSAMVDKFAIGFPVFAKTHVRGDLQADLYRVLTEESGPEVAGSVKWNFTKFLIDPNGRVVARFDTRVDPLADEVTRAIERFLPR